MIRVIPAAERHTVDLGWLTSKPLYSFGEYQQADRNGFGVMRICNDDFLAPARGFGAHPHSDMEIVSIVLNGSIRHEDNMGNDVVSSFGDVQRMSAGSGVIHTEFNASDTEGLRLLQLWFAPAERGAAPSYEARSYDIARMRNALLPVVSSDAALGAPATIGQDMTIYLARLESGNELSYRAKPGRRLFLYAVGGGLSANGAELGEGDVAELEGLDALRLSASDRGDAFLMLIDLP